MAAAELDSLNKLLGTAISSCKKAEEGDAAEQGRAVDALKLLAKQKVTTDLIAKTDGGKKMKKLCKHTVAAIAASAASVVDAWKECVRQEQGQKKQAPAADAAASVSQQPEQGEDEPSKPEPQPEEAGPSSEPQDRASDGYEQLSSPAGQQAKLVLKPAKTGDDMRDKIRELLAEILAGALSADFFGDPCRAAVDVEDAMFRQNGGVNQKYKARYRTLSYNLKAADNPELRRKVLAGLIPGDILVGLSAEELASDDRRSENDKIRESMKKECERGQQNSMASTDQFQ